MPALIKNCGLTTIPAIDHAVSTGASFVGFVHCATSPRHLNLTQLAELVAYAKPSIKTVAVLVAPSDAVLWEIANIAKPDYVQLHKLPSAEHVKKVQDATGIPVISALSVHDAQDIAKAVAFDAVSAHVLFDAPAPGSGKAFDWRLLKNLQLTNSWFLAGGLTPENVAEAIRVTGAPMVDVSSGIESAPGVKSLEKIAAFNAAVLNARA